MVRALHILEAVRDLVRTIDPGDRFVLIDIRHVLLELEGTVDVDTWFQDCVRALDELHCSQYAERLMRVQSSESPLDLQGRNEWIDEYMLFFRTHVSAVPCIEHLVDGLAAHPNGAYMSFYVYECVARQQEVEIRSSARYGRDGRGRGPYERYMDQQEFTLRLPPQERT